MIEEFYETIINNEKLSAKEKLETLETLFAEIQKENKSYLKSAKENILNNYIHSGGRYNENFSYQCW